MTWYSPHKSVRQVLHEGVNLHPVGGDASRPETTEEESALSQSEPADWITVESCVIKPFS